MDGDLIRCTLEEILGTLLKYFLHLQYPFLLKKKSRTINEIQNTFGKSNLIIKPVFYLVSNWSCSLCCTVLVRYFFLHLLVLIRNFLFLILTRNGKTLTWWLWMKSLVDTCRESLCKKLSRTVDVLKIKFLFYSFVWYNIL